MSVELITRRIRTVCADCDAFATSKMVELQRQIRVENSRFRFPLFEEVSGVWRRAVFQKEAAVLLEITRYLEAAPQVDGELIEAVKIEIKRFFADDLGACHLQAYADGLQRSAERCGMRFRREDHGFDLANAAYRSGLANMLRQVRRNLLDALQLQLLKKGNNMQFSSLMRDRLTVLKKAGTKIENVKATVSSDKITAYAEGLLIEPGDLVRREMSNGAQETFEVLDPGFHEAFHGIPASYQMRVRKLGLPEAERELQNITYNLNGPNSRVNQNSIDNSVNSVTVNQNVLQLLEALRHEFTRMDLELQQKANANEIIDAVEHQVQSQKPSKVAVKALLAALPHAATIASIVSTIMSLL